MRDGEARHRLTKRVVLAGGGHAHLQIMRAWQGLSWPEAEVTWVTPDAQLIYSGMLPGWMAGHYALKELTIGVEPLAARAGVSLVLDTLVGLNSNANELQLASGRTLPFDLLSLNVGSNVETAGFKMYQGHLLPVRPLSAFATGWESFLARSRQTGDARVVVVGAGAAGVELALAARYALAKALQGGARAQVTLVGSAHLLTGHAPSVVRRATRSLQHHGVRVLLGRASGTPDGLILETGERIVADAIILATGAHPPPWLAHSGLEVAPDGFIAVGPTQQSVSHPQVFAVGDVATRLDLPHAKSGVYAVRAADRLMVNLQRAVKGEPPLPHVPQKHSLYLMATGPREAIASYGNWSAEGAWVWRWKDFIDRRFVATFQSGELR